MLVEERSSQHQEHSKALGTIWSRGRLNFLGNDQEATISRLADCQAEGLPTY